MKRPRGRPVAGRSGKLRALPAVIACAIFLAPEQVRAQGFFDRIFGTEQAPLPPPGAVSYGFDVLDRQNNADVAKIVRSAAELEILRAQAAPDPDALVRRAEGDLPKIRDALFAGGFYNATVRIRVAGVALEEGQTDLSAAVAAATRASRSGPVQVVAEVDPGRQFTIRTVVVRDVSAGRTLADADLPNRVRTLVPGSPARAAEVRAQEDRLITHYRAQGHALAKPRDLVATVDHASGTMDVEYAIAPGPVTPAGPIAITGAPNIDHAVIASYIYMQPGEIYTTEALQHLRKSVARIEAVSAVRVREADRLDANGQLPLTVDVTERPPRAAGISARFSTVDGPAGRAFIEHRNLFGGAERVRLSADLGYFTDGLRGTRALSDGKGANITGRTVLSFVKPALWGSHFDYLFDAVVERERTKAYDSDLGRLSTGLRYRVDHTLWFSGQIEFEHGKVRDSFGRRQYNLVALPLSVNYDTTDDLLDPTRGVRVQATVSPFLSAFGGTFSGVQSRLQASTYFALDEDARYVLAGRVGFGSTTGASLIELPATRRFFAGGGGSVRGFAYKSLSPKDIFGTPIGGRSLIEGSIEARIRITETIGIVPFLDVGSAYDSAFPDFGNKLRMGAGLGLRYFTPIGPIRLDVAMPLNRERGEKPVGVYVSIGQAF